ncbi:MAG: hypothetical protein AAF620_14100 [Bacteroidota bacterium]
MNLSENKNLSRHKKYSLGFGFLLSSLVYAILFIFYLSSTYRPSNFIPPRELSFYRQLKENMSEEDLLSLQNSPFMYFHYEPGIGIRHYIGGDITTDLDFWSLENQEIAAQAENIFDFLEALDCPYLFFSLGEAIHYDKHGYYFPDWLQVNRIKRLDFPMHTDGRSILFDTGLACR